MGPRVHCQGCGAEAHAAPGQPLPFACAAGSPGDDIDHLLVRQVPVAEGEPLACDPDEERIFSRYRHRLFSREYALAAGLSDAIFCQLAAALDDRIEALDGAGFRRTPVVRMSALERYIGLDGGGRVWAKLDAGNVGGSHKARHLFGLMLALQVDELVRGSHLETRPRLAIASCGNAALAAAVVANAANWPLAVFVPPDASPGVLARLGELDASIHHCERREGEVGDPCVLRFREAVAGGDLPFCCQGTENGLTIEGGETLGYELLEQLSQRGGGMDRLFIQVGGGALASGLIGALRHAVAVGALTTMPRIHAVQTRGGYPLALAWERMIARSIVAVASEGGPAPEDDRPSSQAAWLLEHLGAPPIRAVRQALRSERSAFMAPWPEAPQSIASGILDDETYDWLAIVEGMMDTGGHPVVVDDVTIAEATEIAGHATGVDVSPTGAAGLAGLLQLVDHGQMHVDEELAVILTGRER